MFVTFDVHENEGSQEP